MKKSFNELQQWLVQNWLASRQLEESMSAVREKYEAVFERVIEDVQEESPKLDHCRLHLTEYNGNAGFARKEWPGQYATWPSGLWIGDISLDNLLSDQGDSPCAYIWLSVPKERNFDLETARNKIEKAARGLLKGEKLKYFFKYEQNPRTCLWYDLPESRQALVQMLIDGESEKFVECVAGHVLILARFVPALDEILLRGRR